ncbi:hypothetical protein B0H66DRAFT_602509 [Apodospora peruviana]|uniref:Uncharacterized protein n=1 Tax=Apodospora peruviana TaxID=516989 RepID=A0AAE0M4T5_9PEZI|nr:hypothetical protein B0H66DRAFT_609096 [Apodospora peruviana]KAK3317899.1 hypothetical protein B0H66DRAFT_602509 [Apodospora peruviana]
MDDNPRPPVVGAGDMYYSTLEAVPTPDYAKEVVHNRDHDKEVVPQPAYIGAITSNEHSYQTQTPMTQRGAAWEAGAAGTDNTSEPKILGLKRRTFFIVLWVVSIVIAIAVGVGAGLGATFGSSSRNNSISTTTGVATSEGAINTAAGSGVVGNTPKSTTSVRGSAIITPQSSRSASTLSSSSHATTTLPTITTTTASSSPSGTLHSQSTASAKTTDGVGGGRCSNQWGGDCICLEEGVCRNKWKGTPYTGTPDNLPCPNDPDDSSIMACVVSPCLGKVAPAQCLWKEACRQLEPGTDLTAPICPGDGDFVCCAHSW